MTTDKYYSIQCSSCYNNANHLCTECDIPLCSVCITNECMNCYYDRYKSLYLSNNVSSNNQCDNNYTFFILIIILIVLIIL